MTAGIIFVGLFIFLAHLFSALFEKTRVPDILPLVGLGLLLGPVLGVVTPEFFGALGNIFATITLIIILFQSGLELDLSTLQGSLLSATKLTLAGFFSTMALVSFSAVSLFRLPVLEALILGSIIAGMSPTIVIPLIKKLRLGEQSRAILFLESVFAEVLCVVITLALVQMARSRSLHLEPGLMFGRVIASFLLAGFVGVASAFFWSTVLNKTRRLENGMFLTPAFVFVVYGIAEFLGYSGAIAAFAFGIVLGNIDNFEPPVLRQVMLFKPVRFNETERTFFSEIVFLLKTFFFIYIGVSIRMGDIMIILNSLLITLLVFLSRVPAVRLSLSGLTRFDAAIVSAMAPKGLVAAVLASLPLQAGLAGGRMIQDVIYSIILFSILVSAVLIFLIEKNQLLSLYKLVFPSFRSDGEPSEPGARQQV